MNPTAYSNIATTLEHRDPADLDNLVLLLQERFPASEAWHAPIPPKVTLLASACECLRLARKYRFFGEVALALRMEEAFERACWKYGQLATRGGAR